MRGVRRSTRPAVTGLLLLPLLAACATDPRLPQAPSASPLTAATVPVTQQGNAPVSIDTSTVTFMLDNSGTLVARLSVRSAAAATSTVSIRGSLYGAAHQLVGDLTGGEVGVAPGATVTVLLTGPAPLGTIASATFEASSQASPTPPS